MSVTLYFSKININSHIYNVYEDKKELKRILDLVYLKIKDGVEYKREAQKYQENGETYLYDANYKFSNIHKLDGELKGTIVGTIIKNSKLFINEVDEKTGKIKKKAVPNSEVIDFYFDVHNEIVAFHTTNRFGYQEFNLAFKHLLNISTSEPDEEYNFEVSLLKKGLNVKDIKKELKNIGKLEMLKIEIIPPNPDDGLLDNIQKNGEKYLNSIKAGNITNTSTIFISKTQKGLNLDAKVIEEELEMINKIHPRLSSEEATQNGYVTVEATNKNGRFYTTNDNKPVKDTLDDKPTNPLEFAKACKRKISSILNSLL